MQSVTLKIFIGLKNAALWKATSSNSDKEQQYPSHFATDDDDSCDVGYFKSIEEIDPWWQIDLGTRRVISNVSLNTNDEFGAIVTVTDGYISLNCSRSNVKYNFNCENIVGQVITVKSAKNVMSLCNVFIYAKDWMLPGTRLKYWTQRSTLILNNVLFLILSNERDVYNVYFFIKAKYMGLALWTTASYKL